jgi:two-component system response regulator (stage 0 sporulation protein F)
MNSQKVQIRRQSKKLQIQGAQVLRNEACLQYVAVTKDAVQRKSWTFCEAVKDHSFIGGSPMENILIVDDQPCVRQLVSEELIDEGYGVETVGDAESLRRHLISSRPDLVLLDLYLDESDGFSLLHDIKRTHPDLPVLIFTAYDSFRDDPRLSQADGYLVKSIILDELKQSIAALLRKEADEETNSNGTTPSITVRMAAPPAYPTQ